MTWPIEYKRASQDFETFMILARDAAGLATTNMAWNMVEGVLHVFRRRLTILQAIAFANVLPPVLRALFLDNWHPCEPPEPFCARELLYQEVRALRHEHNFSPPDAIESVSAALWQCVDAVALRKVLEGFPPEAAGFWRLH